MKHERLDQRTEERVNDLITETLTFVSDKLDHDDYSQGNMALNIFFGCIYRLVLPAIPKEGEDEFIKMMGLSFKENFKHYRKMNNEL